MIVAVAVVTVHDSVVVAVAVAKGIIGLLLALLRQGEVDTSRAVCVCIVCSVCCVCSV